MKNEGVARLKKVFGFTESYILSLSPESVRKWLGYSEIFGGRMTSDHPLATPVGKPPYGGSRIKRPDIKYD